MDRSASNMDESGRRTMGHRQHVRAARLLESRQEAVTAHDVRTAARERAEKIWRHNQCRDDGNECAQCVFRQSAFIDGAVWGAAYVTPTRKQIAEALTAG